VTPTISPTIVALLRERYHGQALVDWDETGMGYILLRVQNKSDMDRLDAALDSGGGDAARGIDVRTFQEVLSPEKLKAFRYRMEDWVNGLLRRIEATVFWQPPAKPLPRGASEQTRRSLAERARVARQKGHAR